MNEREYIKFNTSIQTASNSRYLQKDAEGNLEATIELRLPDNIFQSSNGKIIDSVDMQTAKMRLSLENTPLAEIPLDTTLTTSDTLVSTCKLGVYPFCLLDNNQITPDDVSQTAFPHYRSFTPSTTVLEVHLVTDLSDIDSGEIMEIPFDNITSSTDNQPFYNLIHLPACPHPPADTTPYFNLVAKSNHEQQLIVGNKLMIKSQGALEQIFQDALESAITVASCDRKNTIKLYMVLSTLDFTGVTPAPSTNPQLLFSTDDQNFYYWYFEQNVETTITSDLESQVKPRFIFNEQSLTISYDTVPFKSDKVPVLWNTAYVDTFEHPEQFTLSNLRDTAENQPFAKRVYKPTPEITYNAPNGYDSYNLATVPTDYDCKAINIIANQATKETFSFLPWVPVDIRKLQPQHYPQFVLGENETFFYILDGTSARVNVGQNEIMKIPPLLAIQETTVTTNTTYQRASSKFESVNDSSSNKGVNAIAPPVQSSITGNKVERAYLWRSHEAAALSPNGLWSFEDMSVIFDFIPEIYRTGQGRFFRIIVRSIPNDLTHVGSWYPSWLGPGYTLGGEGKFVVVDSPSFGFNVEPNITTISEEQTTETRTIYASDHPSDSTTIMPNGFENNQCFSIYSSNLMGTEQAPAIAYSFTKEEDGVFVNDPTDPDNYRELPLVVTNQFSYYYTTFPISSEMDNQTKPIVRRFAFVNNNLMSQYVSILEAAAFYHTVTEEYDSDARLFRTHIFYFQATQVAGETRAVTDDFIVYAENLICLNRYTDTKKEVEVAKRYETTEVLTEGGYKGNVNLSFTWDNLPMVVLSPIQSIVLTVRGMQVNQEIQPINMTDPTGSSLVSSIPVIENFYSLAQSLRDLHDELVVVKDSFDDTPTYKVPIRAGCERTITLSAQYIDKNGGLHQIYIPKNGVFSLQLVFGVSFYIGS